MILRLTLVDNFGNVGDVVKIFKTEPEFKMAFKNYEMPHKKCHITSGHGDSGKKDNQPQETFLHL